MSGCFLDFLMSEQTTHLACQAQSHMWTCHLKIPSSDYARVRLVAMVSPRVSSIISVCVF